ncbi:MAG: prepilin-type N-terminal cleavage/methylation domain-containing protein [Candidatus Methylacidiphilales bacterium]
MNPPPTEMGVPSTFLHMKLFRILHHHNLFRFQRHAFTLVEVVIAIGIFAFAGVALICLFSVALNANRDSISYFQAATIAKSLLVTRRSVPASAFPQCPLPPINVSAENESVPLLLTAEGAVTTNTSLASFGLIYRVTAPDQPGSGGSDIALISLLLFWPAGALPENALGQYEVVTAIALP